MTSPIRVLSVDDHTFLVAGLKARLDIETDITFVGQLPTADRLVAEVKRTGANIVLIDIEMPGPDPFEAVQELGRQCPETRAIFLSAYVRDRYIDAAYAAGAWGYLSKSDAPDAVVDGIRNVAAGELAFCPKVQARMQASPPSEDRGSSRLASLTAREGQILRLIARGLTRVEIAEQISRSPMTVDNHRKAIMRKLHINDRAELVRFAIAEGLVEV